MEGNSDEVGDQEDDVVDIVPLARKHMQSTVMDSGPGRTMIVS